MKLVMLTAAGMVFNLKMKKYLVWATHWESGRVGKSKEVFSDCCCLILCSQKKPRYSHDVKIKWISTFAQN